jgi:hypothetical protein
LAKNPRNGGNPPIENTFIKKINLKFMLLLKIIIFLIESNDLHATIKITLNEINEYTTKYFIQTFNLNIIVEIIHAEWIIEE